uniref:energy transducer TonB n=1 Tax=Alistipes shahii TaxID=328814 RepID=UPI003FEECEC8
MKRLFMVLFGLASLHAAATAAKAAGEEKTPGKNAGAAASLWPEKMDPSFQGSRPECFKIWVIRNLRFPADRYDVGDEAKVEVAFAIDKNGTLTDLKGHALRGAAFCRPALQDDRPVAEMVARTDEGEARKNGAGDAIRLPAGRPSCGTGGAGALRRGVRHPYDGR